MCQSLAASPALLLDLFLSPGWNGNWQDLNFRRAFRKSFMHLLEAGEIRLIIPEGIIPWLHFCMKTCCQEITEVSEAVSNIIRHSRPSNSLRKANLVSHYPTEIEFVDIVSIMTSVDARIDCFLVTPEEIKSYRSLIRANQGLAVRVSFEILDIRDFPLSNIDTLNADSSGEITVYTPRGQSHILKNGSVPLDFAYKLHNEIGDLFSYAEVNDHQVSPGYKLRDGDIIKIITNEYAIPENTWLFHAYSRKTREKIRRSIKKHYLTVGRGIIEEKLGPRAEALYHDALEKIALRVWGYHSVKYLALSLGDGTIRAEEFNRMLDQEDLGKQITSDHQNSEAAEIDFKFASKCFPIPGTDCHSLYSKSKKGYTVHHCSCEHLRASLGNEEEYDSANSNWKWEDQKWGVRVKIIFQDTPGILLPLLQHIDSFGFEHNTYNVNTSGKNGWATAVMTLYLVPAHGEDMRTALISLSNLDYVKDLKIKDIRNSM